MGGLISTTAGHIAADGRRVRPTGTGCARDQRAKESMQGPGTMDLKYLESTLGQGNLTSLWKHSV